MFKKSKMMAGDTLKQGVNKPSTNHGAQALFAKGGSMNPKQAMALQRARQMAAVRPNAPMPAGPMPPSPGMKCGGGVKKMAKGGFTRGDGCVSKGHTKAR